MLTGQLPFSGTVAHATRVLLATSGTNDGYIRTAENVSEGFGDVFPELPKALAAPQSITQSITPA